MASKTEISTNYKLKEIRLTITHIGKQCECLDSFDCVTSMITHHNTNGGHFTMEFKTFIRCKLPRITTKNGNIKTISLPWAGIHVRHTHKFEHKVIDLLKATKNQTKTANFMQCGFRTVNSIIHNSTKRGLERRDLSSPYGASVIDVVEGRTKQPVR